MRLKDLQGPVVELEVSVAAAATAATTETVVGRVPFRSKVVGAYWIASAAMSGAITANRQLDIVNKGSAGAGTAVPASKVFTASVDAVAFDDTVLTVSGTAATVNCAEGDVLSVQSLVNSTGLPQPAGKIVVQLQAR